MRDSLVFVKACLLLSLLKGVAGAELPTPTGPYVTGVQDFEIIDTVYPVANESDTNGRRLLVRAWYPACAQADFVEGNETMTSSCGSVDFGPSREYFLDGEVEAVYGLPAAVIAAAGFKLNSNSLKYFLGRTIDKCGVGFIV